MIRAAIVMRIGRIALALIPTLGVVLAHGVDSTADRQSIAG